MAANYLKLESHFRRLHRLRHLGAICHWDRAAMMPVGSNEARSEALAELALIRHRRLTDPRVEDWLQRAASEPLDGPQRANLREMRRQWQQASVLPPALVEAKTLAAARCEHGWREQRRRNDWPGFAANLAEVVRLGREEAAIRAETLGIGHYESLLALYEPGMQVARLDGLFGELGTWLPALLRHALARQANRRCVRPAGPFAVDAQRRLGLRLMTQLGFDFSRGRLDVSTHPFCGGTPEDVRITTRYRDDDFLQSLMAVIHEAGHGCYEQNLPAPWLTQPAGRARSMGLHESQSLLFEMQLARHPAFLAWLAPLLRDAFPQAAGDAFEPGNLHRLVTRVRPGLIRVEADELTYPFHVLLRYELERDLIEGRVEVRDIPELWHQKMERLLGLPTGQDYRNGCMQDIHWSEGSFGYFPTYTLGAMVAAQLYAALSREITGLEQQLGAGDFTALSAWLRARIWQHGSLLETDALLQQATAPMTSRVSSPRYFKSCGASPIEAIG